MTSTATGSFEIKGWDEKTYTEIEGGRKLTRASVAQAFTGDLVGEGAVEWLMCYRADGTADVPGPPVCLWFVDSLRTSRSPSSSFPGSITPST